MGSRSKNRNRNKQFEPDRPQPPGDASQWTYSRSRAPATPPATANCGKPSDDECKPVDRHDTSSGAQRSPPADVSRYILQFCGVVAPLYMCLVALEQLGPGSGVAAVGVAVALVAYWNRHPALPSTHQQSASGRDDPHSIPQTPQIPTEFYVQFEGVAFLFPNIYGATQAQFRVARDKGFGRCHGRRANYILQNFGRIVQAELAAITAQSSNSSSTNGQANGPGELHDTLFQEAQFEAAAAAQPTLECLSVAELKVFLQQAGTEVPLEPMHYDQLLSLAKASMQSWECKRLQHCGALLQQYQHNQLLASRAALCDFRLKCGAGELPTEVAKRDREVIKREWQRLVRVVHPDKAVNEQEQHKQLCEDAFKVLTVAYDLVNGVQ